MSRSLSSFEYPDDDFELGDIVEFDAPYGGRLTGDVVRVYNTRSHYHVEVDGSRYEVSRRDDNMQKVK